MLVNRCSNICSFFLQVLQLEIKTILFDYNIILYIILYNWFYCIALAAWNTCQLLFAGLERYIYLLHLS